jgi:sulfite exporter TauE/SafE/nucleoid-associated protein YgaU/copper chaperone CopZ
MHCHGCEHIIEISVGKLLGVRKVRADYPSEIVSVDFDPAATTCDEIRAAIERAGYRVVLLGGSNGRRRTLEKFIGLMIGAAGVLLIIFFDTEWISQGGTPDISQHMSLQLIFVLGLLTGFHCIGMCGGFVLSYTADDASAGRRSYLSHVLYGAGKTLSYTIIGAIFGLLGAVVALTPLLRGVAGMMAGAFLIVFGLNMLGMFAPLRRFRLGLPAPVQAFVQRQARSQHRPFIIGLLNGLMIACGPLQAMYVMAAGTGSAFEGAKMLFAFGVGTLPVLTSFGILTTLISRSLTHRLLKASGAIVVVLGAVMINRGLILTGSGYDLRSVIGAFSRASKPRDDPTLNSQSPMQTTSEPALATQSQPAPAPGSGTRPAFQTITMDVVKSGFSPNHFTLIRGAPVKWVINGKEITTCNNRIVVPSLKLEFNVKKGRQVIEFTPQTTGVIPWSCWMGMLHGEFEVVDGSIAATTEPSTASSTSETLGKSHGSLGAEAPASAPSKCNGYIVVAGDSLRGIAAKLYRDAQKWREIAAANPGLDARRLRRGQLLKLPSIQSSRDCGGSSASENN